MTGTPHPERRLFTAVGILIAAFFTVAVPSVQGVEKSGEGTSGAEDARTALASRLTQTVAELRRVREERYRLEKRHASDTRSLKHRVAELEARKQSLKAKTEALKKKAEDVKGQIASLNRETETIRSRLKKAGDALRDAAGRLRDAIRDSIPFRREERIASIDAVLGRLDSEPLPDRVRSVNAVLDYEIALGSTAEAYRARVDLGENRIPRARCVRLGMVSLAFITEDGETIGVLTGQADGKLAWKTDLGFWDRWAIKRALEILEKRRPPVFTPFPMDLGRVKKAGGEPARGAPPREEGGR
jgi:chaperonin cofactor prefoldin